MKIDRDNKFDGFILGFAVRYALGRVSNAPFIVSSVLEKVMGECSDDTLICIRRDILSYVKEARENENISYIQNMEVETWESLLDKLNNEIDSRGI